ncbi:MAG: hypothetical protein M1484_02035 [Patescibacteria group bacterium]|nr:hypothetical protein [Patescibacteria group bacterium]MCL5431860.1 hypothetical protein [Patescibacteria group bacterium]
MSWPRQNKKYLLVSLLIGFALTVGVVHWRVRNFGAVRGVSDVAVPTIINGNLVLPKVTAGASNLGSVGAKLGVVSANLVPVMDQQSQQVTAIRIIGEMQNTGTGVVTGISPQLRFLDSAGNVVAQKIADLTTGYSVFGVGPGETTVYDVSVPNPPSSDKLEIILNVSQASGSGAFDELKIASRSMEVKTAVAQGAAASESGTQSFDYYTVTGSVINVLSDPVSDISVYAWVKDEAGKVFAFAKQDFPNDLVSPREKLDFRINLLPLRTDEKYDSYEVAAWGKRYLIDLK